MIKKKQIEVSLNSMARLTTHKSMKLEGLIGEQKVLIDCGDSHYFISFELVKKIQFVSSYVYGPFKF